NYTYLFLILKKFSVNEIKLYGLNRTNYKVYLPNSIRYKISLNTNNGYWPIVHDKMIFYDLIQGKLETPELLGLIFRGEFLSRCEIKRFSDLVKMLQK